MNFDLTDEQISIREEARTFVSDVLTPVAPQLAREHRFPHEILKQLAEKGYLGGPIPQEWGGRGYDYITHGPRGGRDWKGLLIDAQHIFRSPFSLHASALYLGIRRTKRTVSSKDGER